jgi:hypothetical protein
MTQPANWGLNVRRAIVTFVAAYVAITILGTALSIGIGITGHYPATAEPLKNVAYLISERFLPFLNLLVWGAFAAVYFRHAAYQLPPRQEAVRLGAFWLAIALPVDLVGFVLIKNPISLSPEDFYIGQFPWIYLIYIAVLISPFCYVALREGVRGKASA